MERREFVKVTAGGTAAVAGLGTTTWGQPRSQAGEIAVGGPAAEAAYYSRSLGTAGNAMVKRVYDPENGRFLQVHLFVNAAIYHTARLGQGPVDIGVKVMLFYTSGGHMVVLQGSRKKRASLQATALDTQTMRVMMMVPFGSLWPDPGTKFADKVDQAASR